MAEDQYDAQTLSIQGRPITQSWLTSFEDALTKGNVSRAVELFTADGSWRDLVVFTGSIRSFNSPSEIAAALRDCASRVSASSFEVVKRVEPEMTRRAGRDVLEAIFEFETAEGTAEGVLRLVEVDTGRWRALTLMTALRSWRGHEPLVGARRPRTKDQGIRFGAPNWLEVRRNRQSAVPGETPVVIIGAGQCGLATAAHLKALGVDCIVLDREARVGDNWRKRYDSLVLHTESPVNSLPFLSFPDNWPDFIPKDKLAHWLESYAEIMELDVWPGCEVTHCQFDPATELWTVEFNRTDGSSRKLHARNVVVATGLSDRPRIPEIPGLEHFKGLQLHSEDFANGSAFVGKSAMVVGAGTSGHDIAQDLHAHGANVTIVQRGPMTVVNLEPTAVIQYALYKSDLSTSDIDLISIADPYPAMLASNRDLTQVFQSMDAELIAGLNRVGFKTHYGPDGTGHVIQYYRTGGGYYFNVGASDLIASGEIGLRHFEDIETFTESGVKFSNDDFIELDLVVFATGYYGPEDAVKRLFGAEVAERLGQIWGFGHEGEFANMFKKTSEPGLWFIGGGLPHARYYSRFLALQIQRAELDLAEKGATA